MQQKGKNKNQKEDSCYYVSYTLCTCNMCKHLNNRCAGKEECENYISEGDYFMRMMNGESMAKDMKSEKENSKPAKQYNLAPGKSKKALKKEAKLEAEKNPSGSGFSIKDDPRFKDLFQDLK